MEKKAYETPAIEVIELDTAPQILAGSPPLTAEITTAKVDKTNHTIILWAYRVYALFFYFSATVDPRTTNFVGTTAVW